jgi:aminoglycoside/choline kinase family phosphotransferase
MLESWLAEQPGLSGFSMQPASGDASFRRYFRVRANGKTLIAMDAPPANEDCRPFVTIARAFAALGLHVPAVISDDLERGFLLLEDLGSEHYLDVLSPDNAQWLYGDALGALVIIQACGPRQGLPDYDRALLMRELGLFRAWLLERHLRMNLSTADEKMLDTTYEFLVRNAQEQPRVCVHRDYHSRNLLVTDSPSPGILDFQDAVVGPVTYDLVSLLRDCYIAWPRDQVEDWAKGYYELAVQSGVLREEHERRFLRWFDLMGVQRHLKASGIFARLNQRDGKHAYLGDIPRTLNYIVQVARDYPELAGLGRMIENAVLPALRDRLDG